LSAKAADAENEKQDETQSLYEKISQPKIKRSIFSAGTKDTKNLEFVILPFMIFVVYMGTCPHG